MISVTKLVLQNFDDSVIKNSYLRFDLNIMKSRNCFTITEVIKRDLTTYIYLKMRI